MIAENAYPVLVLNADYRPLSYYPLSLWSWQDAVKAVFLDKVNVVAEYDRDVRGPRRTVRIPSVISLRDYVTVKREPLLTRYNIYLRDGFSCLYCGSGNDLTFDHVVPRCRGGETTWQNTATACSPCNARKGSASLARSGLAFRGRAPYKPTVHDLQAMGRRFPPNHLHESWADYLYWDVSLEP